MTQNTNAYDHPSPFSPNGRLNRLSYLAWSGFVTFLMVAIMFCIGMFMPNTFNVMMDHPDSTLLQVFSIVLNLIILIFYMIFSIKRLHDFNRNGWLSLIIFIPFVNLIFTLYLACRRGDVESNNYGEARPSLWWEKGLAYFSIFFTVVGFLAFTFSIFTTG